MRDIESHADCRVLVETFYSRARKDELLGPIFELRVQGRWPEHLGRMADFWAAVILGMPGFAGRPLERHLGLGIGSEHFEHWLRLWTSSVDDDWSGPHAEHAKRAARHIATRMASFLAAAEARELCPGISTSPYAARLQ